MVFSPLNIRKLAAIDIVFLGFKVVAAEYAFGVLFSIGLGIFVEMCGVSPLRLFVLHEYSDKVPRLNCGGDRRNVHKDLSI